MMQHDNLCKLSINGIFVTKLTQLTIKSLMVKQKSNVLNRYQKINLVKDLMLLLPHTGCGRRILALPM